MSGTTTKPQRAHADVVHAFIQQVFPEMTELQVALCSEEGCLQEATKLIRERRQLRSALESARTTIERLTGQALPEDNEICQAMRTDRPATCTWTQDADGIWTCAACGNVWWFDTDGPRENQAHYCQRCGLPIDQVVPYVFEAGA